MTDSGGDNDTLVVYGAEARRFKARNPPPTRRIRP
jgi:hypothetical protein